MMDILENIYRLRVKRGWSEYELAKASGLPQSTISTWYSKGQTPTVASLEKVCQGFGITLSQFFAEERETIFLTAKQRELLDRWSALTLPQQKVFLALLEYL